MELELPTSDEMIASGAKFLIEGGEDDAASVLLACSVESIEVENSYFMGSTSGYDLVVWLRGPRPAFNVVADEQNPIRSAVENAIKAVLPQASSESG